MKIEDKVIVLIDNSGCDDTTSAEIEMTMAEYKSLSRIVEELNSYSTYGCQPKIFLYLKEQKNKVIKWSSMEE